MYEHYQLIQISSVNSKLCNKWQARGTIFSQQIYFYYHKSKLKSYNDCI